MSWFMMAKLFIDSSFIIPIFKRNDTNRPIIEKNKEILFENDCYISNGIIQEITTVVMMKTKSIELTKKAYHFLNDNFNILNEYEIETYNNRVFSVFKKYNNNTYKASFIDCSAVVIADNYDLDYVVSLDNIFNKFDEINLLKLD
ncbi:PIN domain-containing protein [Methanobrevibacter olleyae]|nr:PIN domain-containing protein [Methanobrevibacter olleyae]